ncbi:MAG TPA: riboflavin biosynthesis protein RibF [Firmicutes bacterium]|nr:riboflavin biosynthesis protein RibF [Bacillota bacterium]
MHTIQTSKCVVALGFFDGVHRGHGALLRRVAQRAEELGAEPAALSFARHPRELITGRQVPLLNTPADRAWLMRTQYGIRRVELLPFDRDMMEMPWDRFVTDVVAGRFGAVHVVVGGNHRFGYRGEGTPERLAQLCRTLGLGCDVMGQVDLDGVRVSSTHIRGLLEAGEMETANRFLGHPHILTGRVVRGKQLGRTLGIPTANLALPEGVLPPAFGVYATRVTAGGQTHLAVTNVGVRPTVDQDGKVTVEPWVLDYSGNLYDQEIRVEFHARLRPERRFDGVEQLRQEILRNAGQTRAYFAGVVG